uniref:endogenous retrovirus group K member 7 Pro protein-like n=1 Tax=Jaculus jaculus TaxID=51337 RepID=UPI001E1B18FD|nr:endogenous retrovirus group K member 7 Pro protein-like [Jaculus jaculus]
MGCQPIPSDFKGPLPPDTVGLVLGRSSSALKGLIVHPGVIDEDYEGQVKILCSSPRGISSISCGDRIAQLLVLPSLHGLFPYKKDTRGTKGLGSSRGGCAYVSLDLDERPTLELIIRGKIFSGILDTGADTSIISTKWWPSNWPVNQSSQTLQGLGYESSPSISAQALRWRDHEGRAGEFIPYVLPLPVNLWGRDILHQMKFKLTNDYSSQSQQIMRDMGCVPEKGLGKMSQGSPEPVTVTQKLDRKGLGFS